MPNPRWFAFRNAKLWPFKKKPIRGKSKLTKKNRRLKQKKNWLWHSSKKNIILWKICDKYVAKVWKYEIEICAQTFSHFSQKYVLYIHEYAELCADLPKCKTCPKYTGLCGAHIFRGPAPWQSPPPRQLPGGGTTRMAIAKTLAPLLGGLRGPGGETKVRTPPLVHETVVRWNGGRVERKKKGEGVPETPLLFGPGGGQGRHLSNIQERENPRQKKRNYFWSQGRRGQSGLSDSLLLIERPTTFFSLYFRFFQTSGKEIRRMK